MKKKLVWVAVMGAMASLYEMQAARAASFEITNGSTSNTAQTLGANTTGQVDAGGTLSVSGSTVAVTITGSNTSLTNSGTIIQTGTGRAIRENTGGLTYTITNNTGATIQTADGDVFQANKANANVIINNYGTLTSLNASLGGNQVLDLNAITTGTNIVNNYATGIIQASEADAVRPGVNGVVNNAGLIISTTTTGSSSDGVDAQSNTGVTVNNTGKIEGGRHGITGGNTDTSTNGAYAMTVVNAKGATIQGDNGSGINIDGLNGNEVVTVTNNGTITGNGVTGDGDGIDIDGLLNLNNTGTIKSIQAAGNLSEGLSVGGGTIVNSGLIEGDNAVGNGGSRGISLVGNDSTTGSAIRDGLYGNTSVTNSGTIRGQTGAGIGVTGLATSYTASITNLAGGLIEGGGTEAAVFSLYQALNVTNYGTITADTSGVAISLGSAAGTVQILGGAAQVNGDIDGGTGGSSLTITPGSGNSFTDGYRILNFASVAIGQGTTTLNGVNSYAGTTSIASGGTLIVGDASHSTATGGSGTTTVASGAILGGYGSVLGSVVNAGTIAVGDTVSGFANSGKGTFRIAGNYTGNNGTVLLNTALAGTGSAVATDALVIGGNASGSTNLVVHATGTINNGSATTGSGIALVQVAGTSTANAFHLTNTLQGGAYQYLLYQGSQTNANSYYLRSTLEAANGGASNAPVAYRPGVAGYSMTPSLNIDYGFSIMGRRDERMGVSSQRAQDAHANGIWGRLDGGNLNANSMGRFAADERTFFAQFGKDWTLSADPAGNSTHAGVMVTLGNASTQFSDSARSINTSLSTRTGTLETHAESLGGYWTRNFANGIYFDGVGQLTHYRNRYGDIYADTGSQNGFGAGASGEVGKPFSIMGTAIAIEPQVQLMYQYLHLNGFNDSVSAVSGNATSALRGRAGFRIFHADMSSADGHSYATPYFMADVIRDFLKPGQTAVGGTTFDDGLARTQYDFGVGVSFNAGKSSTFYANIKYARNIGGDYRRDVSGLAGYRLSW